MGSRPPVGSPQPMRLQSTTLEDAEVDLGSIQGRPGALLSSLGGPSGAVLGQSGANLWSMLGRLETELRSIFAVNLVSMWGGSGGTLRAIRGRSGTAPPKIRRPCWAVPRLAPSRARHISPRRNDTFAGTPVGQRGVSSKSEPWAPRFGTRYAADGASDSHEELPPDATRSMSHLALGSSPAPRCLVARRGGPRAAALQLEVALPLQVDEGVLDSDCAVDRPGRVARLLLALGHMARGPML